MASCSTPLNVTPGSSGFTKAAAAFSSSLAGGQHCRALWPSVSSSREHFLLQSQQKRLFAVQAKKKVEKANEGGSFEDGGEIVFGGMEARDWTFRVAEEGQEEDPWVGAVVFRRSKATSECRWETSLERLGLARLSSSLSKEEAAREKSGSAAAGAAEGAAGSVQGGSETPVTVVASVEEDGRDLILTGTASTVFGINCKWCLAPVAERIESTFTAVLSAAPIEEPTKRNLGVVLGDANWKPSSDPNGADFADDVLDLDLGDKFYFPTEMKEIDLSKFIRDTLHLDIPLDVRCQKDCKGMCLDCGVNLNQAACRCKQIDIGASKSSALAKQLQKQLEEYNKKKGLGDV